MHTISRVFHAKWKMVITLSYAVIINNLQIISTNNQFAYKIGQLSLQL